jgi:ankyrin repeat protein
MAPLSAIVGFAASGDLRLADAVEHRDQPAIHSLLKQGVDVNAPQPDGSTALTWAAHWNDTEIADLLIAAGANVNAASEYGSTPLWEACINASAPMVQKLVKAGANPNVALPGTGETVLMRCARTGNAEAVKALLAAGANANAKEASRGQTALMWALEEVHPEAARALIENGADIHAKSKGGFTPLLFAARQGDLEAARMLLDKGADVNEAAPGGLNALLVAIDSMHEDFAIFLVEKGANPNVVDRDGLTPLHYALRKGYTFLKSGQRDDHYGQIGLPYLFRDDMTKLVPVLLDHGANPNARITRGGRRNQLHQSDFVKITVAGATPFLLAAASGDVAVMRLLLAKGADPKITTNDGVTALMAAAGVGLADDRMPQEAQGALQAVKMLVEEVDFDVNAVSKDLAWTALHGAAYIGANDIIQYLVDKGAKPDVKDEMGQTPLTIAEGDPNWLSDDHDRKRHPTTAELLRKLGGDPLGQASGMASVGGVVTYPLIIEGH